MNILKEKTAIITGASMGIGFEIAKGYINAGASIIICSRNKEELYGAEDNLRKILSNNQKILAIPADISLQEDIDNLFYNIHRNNFDVNILVNNAGIMGIESTIDDANWQDWINVININLLGSVLMCKKILPIFKNNKYGKILQLSGGGATLPTPNFSSYAVSKAGIVRFIETLAKEVGQYNIDVNAIAPGKLKTRMNKEVNNNDSVDFSNVVNLSIFLASDKSNGITGKLISAQWDNWEDFPNHLEELKNSDVYTLRRIVGKERNMLWGDRIT